MTLRFFARKSVLVLASFLIAACSAWAAPRHPNAASLNKNSREIFDTAMQWGDRAWNPEAQLCGSPANFRTDGTQTQARATGGYFMVRDSVWYAIGLLLRDQPGDRERAAQIIRAVLKQQYHEPDKPWDGTFRRSPNEPEPGADAQMWRAFDPNWREFIGTAFAVILNEYPDRIPSDLAQQMIESIDYAVAGEMKEKRLKETYTNISLMYGFLWNFAAVRGNRPDWVAPATKWQEDTYRLFKEHDAFWEYNSPTYSGVDIFALALWRDYGFTPRMKAIGSEMEAALWRAIADLYNANLRNISGPYDRAYGMDMQSYVSVVGLWLRTVLDADHAPLTGFDPPVDHVADLWLTPAIVVLDTEIPRDAMKSFQTFQGEHEVRRPIEGPRVATAFIGKQLIYGGEITGQTRNVDGTSQFHPVTAQWLAPGGKIGWIQLTRCPAIDASADKGGIVISATGDVSFRISAPGIAAQNAAADSWSLPGLSVRVKSDAKSFTATQHGQFVDVEYKGISMMVLSLEPSAAANK
jgi:hypothetical protein